LDYDLYQSQLFPNYVKYIPYLINNDENKKLAQLIKNTKKIYDVVMCPVSNCERRLLMYEQLTKCGLNVLKIEGIYGDIRDQMIASGKILLNINHYGSAESGIFTHYRCDRWVLAGLLVVSENTMSDSCLDIRSLIHISNYDNMATTIKQLLSDYDRIHHQYITHLLELGETIINDRNQSVENFFLSGEKQLYPAKPITYLYIDTINNIKSIHYGAKEMQIDLTESFIEKLNVNEHKLCFIISNELVNSDPLYGTLKYLSIRIEDHNYLFPEGTEIVINILNTVPISIASIIAVKYGDTDIMPHFVCKLTDLRTFRICDELNHILSHMITIIKPMQKICVYDKCVIYQTP
jgi:hypothetical protein